MKTRESPLPPILVNTNLEAIQDADLGARHASPAAGSRVA